MQPFSNTNPTRAKGQDYMTGDLGLLMFNLYTLRATDSCRPSLHVLRETHNYLFAFPIKWLVLFMPLAMPQEAMALILSPLEML